MGWALALAACTGPDRPPRDRDGTASHSAAPPVHTGAHSTAGAHTGDGPAGVLPTATWHDVHEDNTAGRGLWVGDLDGDDVTEVLIGAPTWASGYGGGETSVAYRLVGMPPSGPLPRRATQWMPGIDDDDHWGDWVVGLPSLGLAAVTHSPDTRPDAKAFLFSPREGRTLPNDATALLRHPSEFGFPMQLADCHGVGGTGELCMSGVPGGIAGAIRLYEGPLVGTVTQWLTEWTGDAGDDLQYLHGAADLDGDGNIDALASGIYHDRLHGALAMVDDVTPGSHRLWDAAHTVLTGVEEGAWFGTTADAGDVDGDGALDLVVSAPNTRPVGVVYAFRGPFAGDRSAADADLVVSGVTNALLADLDGDGVDDLAAAGIRQIGVWFGPRAAGRLDLADADVLLASDAPPGDGLGWRMAAGDLDGDGAHDLVVSAPYDGRGAPLAGAVHAWTHLRGLR